MVKRSCHMESAAQIAHEEAPSSTGPGAGQEPAEGSPISNVRAGPVQPAPAARRHSTSSGVEISGARNTAPQEGLPLCSRSSKRTQRRRLPILELLSRGKSFSPSHVPMPGFIGPQNEWVRHCPTCAKYNIVEQQLVVPQPSPISSEAPAGTVSYDGIVGIKGRIDTTCKLVVPRPLRGHGHGHLISLPPQDARSPDNDRRQVDAWACTRSLWSYQDSLPETVKPWKGSLSLSDIAGIFNIIWEAACRVDPLLAERTRIRQLLKNSHDTPDAE